MSTQSAWRKIRLAGYLDRGSCIIFTGKQGWNVLSVNYGWKSVDYRADIISMLRLQFLTTNTGSAGYVTDN